MKISVLRYCLLVITIGLVVVACSTKKDKFINRNYHALTTKYNVMYNGNLALEAGLNDLKSSYNDNFWEILPVERMQIIEPVFGQDSVPRNANFKRAEEKAVKAIENHSMYLGGVERNPQMDESYLLLGKARYYDQRFFPALEAFNFILLRYPDSDKVNELKIWKEKTNIRLDNNTVAIKNLEALVTEIDFKDEVLSDAYAILAQAYINENQKDKAVESLIKAKEYSKSDDDKARYTFILGQLYETQNQNDLAIQAFQEVIDMNRKSPRQYVMWSHGKLSLLGGVNDSVAFLKKYTKLLNDRENRPYLDVLNHQVALYYDKHSNKNQAISYYNQSLKHQKGNAYLMASNYRNLAEIYFYDAKYSTAGKYYDSTLVKMDPSTREYRNIRRKRNNLDDVIKYEAIAVANDSVLRLVAMTEQEREVYFSEYISDLKKNEELLQKQAQKYIDLGEVDKPKFNDVFGDDPMPEVLNKRSSAPKEKSASKAIAAKQNQQETMSILPPGMSAGLSNQQSNFYFYNQTTLSFGKNEFRKRWGSRSLKDYWRLSNYSGASSVEDFDSDEAKSKLSKEDVEPRFTTQFYIAQIPNDQVVIDSLQKDRNFAYYQLGMIYKDRFKEYKLAQSKFEDLLQSNPEERLVLPSMYNLYRIYEILGSSKKEALKAEINSKYPDSRYASLINNPSNVAALEASNDQVYKQIYSVYQSSDFRKVLKDIEPLIDQYAGEEIVSKLELLKANAIGNLKGLDEYVKALNFVALSYPNSEEGKEAEIILNTNIPKFEKMNFGVKPASYKLIYKVPVNSDLKELNNKLAKVIEDRSSDGLKQTLDSYTLNEDFVVIHNIYDLQDAKDLLSVMRDYKGYKIQEEFIYISSEDYKVVQVKKNLSTYLENYKNAKP